MTTASSTKYRRILLKLSGEALMGDAEYGINKDVLQYMVDEIKTATDLEVEVGIVIGGGNFFRGLSDSASSMDRANGDYIGMLATIMNALALQGALNKSGMRARVLSALKVGEVIPAYSRDDALTFLANKEIVIFAAGTGNPFFTTDTAASLRALEIDADLMLKATKVDGVYDKDPAIYDDAERYDTLTYNVVLEKNLGVMDAAAVALCRDNNLPLYVFNVNHKGALASILTGTQVGTLVQAGE
ncbi:MAG: UMP kinase [Gammaproteobacteria bacterium]|nr:MAG: UMP kinase [Gammaproteobacteria bacterium]